MKNRVRISIAAYALIGAVAPAAAQAVDSGDLDGLTMTLMLDPAADLPDAVTRTIELPAAAADQAKEHSADGLATANAARVRREEGLATAAAARERGQEVAEAARDQASRFGEEIAAAAQESREAVGRRDDLVPELPSPADLIPAELPVPAARP